MTSTPGPRHNHANTGRVETPTELAESLQNAAREAIARGWHVFPLVPGGKTPAIKNWEVRATTDPDRIARCWTPSMSNSAIWNVGIACGPSGLIVLDLDTVEADSPDGFDDPGEVVLARLLAEQGEMLPETFACSTPSGGRHLYYANPTAESDEDAVRIGNSAGRLGPHIDTRGAGGYVVAPGSRIDETGRYYLAEDRARPVAALPAWLIDRLTVSSPDATAALPAEERRRRAYIDKVVRNEIGRVLDSRPDRHNDALFVASAHLGELVAGGHLDEATMRAVLVAAGQRVGQPFTEARATVESGFRNGANNPRPITHPASGAPANPQGRTVDTARATVPGRDSPPDPYVGISRGRRATPEPEHPSAKAEPSVDIDRSSGDAAPDAGADRDRRRLVEDEEVRALYPLPDDDPDDRATWHWLPAVVLDVVEDARVGLEYRVLIDDDRLAESDADGVTHPTAYRDRSEVRSVAEDASIGVEASEVTDPNGTTHSWVAGCTEAASDANEDRSPASALGPALTAPEDVNTDDQDDDVDGTEMAEFVKRERGAVDQQTSKTLPEPVAERVARSATRRPASALSEQETDRRNYVEAGARGLYATELAAGSSEPNTAVLAQLGHLSGGGYLHPSTVYAATCHCCAPGPARDDCVTDRSEPGAGADIDDRVPADDRAPTDADSIDHSSALAERSSVVEKAQLAAAAFGARLAAAERQARARTRDRVNHVTDLGAGQGALGRGEAPSW